jgi:hypothetical protein
MRDTCPFHLVAVNVVTIILVICGEESHYVGSFKPLFILTLSVSNILFRTLFSNTLIYYAGMILVYALIKIKYVS